MGQSVGGVKETEGLVFSQSSRCVICKIKQYGAFKSTKIFIVYFVATRCDRSGSSIG